MKQEELLLFAKLNDDIRILKKQIDVLIKFQKRAPRTEIIKVIKQTVSFGDGTDENPTRNIIRYWGLNGKLLAECDNFISEQLEVRE